MLFRVSKALRTVLGFVGEGLGFEGYGAGCCYEDPRAFGFMGVDPEPFSDVVLCAR